MALALEDGLLNSIFLSNLLPKVNQHPSKIDVKMLSYLDDMLDPFFWDVNRQSLVFARPTTLRKESSTPWWCLPTYRRASKTGQQ